MAVKLRLKRMGKKKQPTYRVVAADSRSPRDGRFIESIGFYAPRAEPPEVRGRGDAGVELHGADDAALAYDGDEPAPVVRKRDRTAVHSPLYVRRQHGRLTRHGTSRGSLSVHQNERIASNRTQRGACGDVCGAPAPGPVASTSGKWPITVAAVVIRIGRSRVPAASTTALILSNPCSCR